MGWKTAVGRKVNAALGLVGLELSRRPSLNYVGEKVHVKEFLPFKETLQAAKESGMELVDYIDDKHAKPGATAQTIEGMKKLGVFERRLERVCEIGPGTGRYLEQVVKQFQPSYYEIYETAVEWADYLKAKYHVQSHPPDGKSLSRTASDSVDLVHAHKVFVYLPFVTSMQYFTEMVRVSKPGGFIVFDVVTEECMNDATLAKWCSADATFPAFMCKKYLVDFFARKNVQLVGSFFAPMVTGKTECVVLKNQS